MIALIFFVRRNFGIIHRHELDWSDRVDLQDRHFFAKSPNEEEEKEKAYKCVDRNAFIHSLVYFLPRGMKLFPRVLFCGTFFIPRTILCFCGFDFVQLNLETKTNSI